MSTFQSTSDEQQKNKFLTCKPDAGADEVLVGAAAVHVPDLRSALPPHRQLHAALNLQPEKVHTFSTRSACLYVAWHAHLSAWFIRTFPWGGRTTAPKSSPPSGNNWTCMENSRQTPQACRDPPIETVLMNRKNAKQTSAGGGRFELCMW